MIRLLVALAITMSVTAQNEPAPPVGEAPSQPLPFSHKTHAPLGLKCLECHKTAAQSTGAGLPAESICMTCHVLIKRDSPSIQILAGFHSRKEPVPWVRLYRLPDFVYFSHKRHHGKAQIACAACHGEVERRDVLSKAKSIGMQSCMRCHDERKANNNCDACHAPHPG